MNKICSSCKENKDLSEFHKDKSKSLGHASKCKICSAAACRNLDLKRYGITQEQFDKMAESQGYACKICGTTKLTRKTLDIDHCHKSGVVRGLLCRPCNMALGLFKDNSELITKAIEYLERTK